VPPEQHDPWGQRSALPHGEAEALATVLKAESFFRTSALSHLGHATFCFAERSNSSNS
jgi:hypothetical protein